MTDMRRRTFLGVGAAAAGGLVLGQRLEAAARSAAAAKRTVVVWSEGTAPANVYPKDINTAIAEGLRKSLRGWDVVVANLSDADQGIPDDLLKKTDVLIWWGHKKHKDVKDELVEKIVKRVKEEGMGFISLHSSHFAKPNKALMGTPCTWGAYKGDSTTCTVKVKDRKHPIAEGLPAEFTFDHSEHYSEPYAVPEPKSVVFDGFHKVKDGSIDNARMGPGVGDRQGQVLLLHGRAPDQPGVHGCERPEGHGQRREVGGGQVAGPRGPACRHRIQERSLWLKKLFPPAGACRASTRCRTWCSLPGACAQGAPLANGPRHGNRNAHSLPASGGTGTVVMGVPGTPPAPTRRSDAPGSTGQRRGATYSGPGPRPAEATAGSTPPAAPGPARWATATGRGTRAG